jgi:hypothetical protein
MARKKRKTLSLPCHGMFAYLTKFLTELTSIRLAKAATAMSVANSTVEHLGASCLNNPTGKEQETSRIEPILL